jgi:GNAT superfamily N-acetyltransferase
VSVADERRLDPVIELLEEAADWLWSRGIQQWEPGSIRPQRPTLLRWARSGALAVATTGDDVAGACFLVDEPSREWADRSGRALYLHKLVVARAHAGKGVARELLEWCAEQAREREVRQLRLDCWDGSHKLRAFYRAAGYRELEAVPSLGYAVRLFEREIDERTDLVAPG